ncbi:MAG: dihydropteroate synthase [Candidatus Marinimicrobia bacterium]|nr:dihydropteroate synthase [Candidatus Neomarinimicrobiota bacterium]
MTVDRVSSEIGQKWLIKDQELHLDIPVIMGILNVTPDSFSDGGQFIDPSKAVSRALEMVDQGATIIDVGGESTRPGSLPISVKVEVSRTIPVIKALAAKSDVFISIDTQKAAVAQAAIKAGAHIVNDISAGQSDSEMFTIVSGSRAGYILMHMQGKPETMQVAPVYNSVLDEVAGFLVEKLDSALLAGIDLERIIVDPGIGFGKSLDDNLKLMANLHRFNPRGRPLLLGASRKSFIGMIDNSAADQRLGGSLAAVISAFLRGVRIFRVHDVAETSQVLDIFSAIQKHSD